MNCKRIISGIALVLAAISTPNASIAANDIRYGDDTIFDCDFEDLEASKEAFVMYNYCTAEYSTLMKSLGFSEQKPWLLYLLDDQNVSSDHFAGAASQFNIKGQSANAWLVTKEPITVGKNSYLSWKSQASSQTLRDGLKVFISTTGNDPKANFSASPEWEIAAESAGIKVAIDYDWTSHEISLEKYAGKKIYVAFVNQSMDKEIICLDDIAVTDKTPFEITSTVAKMTDANNVEISAQIKARDKAINKFKAYYSSSLDNSVKSIEFSNVSIAPDSTFNFTFTDKLSLPVVGEYTNYTIWASSDEENNFGVNGTVAHVAFMPKNVAVLEEGTGSWCGNCPTGFLAIDYIKEKFPNNFIPIAVHNNDAMTVSAYDIALGMNAFPSGRINRGEKTMPMLDSYGFEGKGTFHDAVKEDIDRVPTIEAEIANAQYYGDSVKVSTNIKFPMAFNDENSYKIAYTILEDDVIANPQHNYFYKSDNPVYGDFNKNGIYNAEYVKNYPYQHVARGIYPEYRGMEISLPAEVSCGVSYPVDYKFSIDGIKINNTSKLSLVALVLDAKTGRILNADVKKLDDLSSVKALESDNLNIASFDGKVLTSLCDNLNVNVYSVNGQNVYSSAFTEGDTFDTQNLSKGCYIIEVSNNLGKQVWKVLAK